MSVLRKLFRVLDDLFYSRHGDVKVSSSSQLVTVTSSVGGKYGDELGYFRSGQRVCYRVRRGNQRDNSRKFFPAKVVSRENGGYWLRQPWSRAIFFRELGVVCPWQQYVSYSAHRARGSYFFYRQPF
jgi:hypothetical protein